MYTTALTIHICGWALSCFYIYTIINNVSVNIWVHISLQIAEKSVRYTQE